MQCLYKVLSDLSEKKKKDDEDRSTVRQDKDIEDKSSSQPAKYYKGIKSKSTKSARDAHFKKVAKKSDDDPSAYEPAPAMLQQKQNLQNTRRNSSKCLGEVSTDEEDNPENRRKKANLANSDKHSDLYTDENPKELSMPEVCYCRRCKSKCEEDRRALVKNMHIKFKRLR